MQPLCKQYGRRQQLALPTQILERGIGLLHASDEIGPASPRWIHLKE
jgi:hypothetical protein